MKITTGILGCALVAGLMTFASGNAHAKNLVISNEVYAPFNLKISAQYADSNNKLKKASLTSKQYLKDQGFNDKVQLAVNTTTFEVWVINKDSLVSNLSTATNGNTLTLEFDSVQRVQKNSNNESFTETGVLYVYSDTDVDYFDISGVYSQNQSWSKVDKNNEQTYKDDLKAKNLSGYGYFSTLSESDVPVTGSADFKGSGKILVD